MAQDDELVERNRDAIQAAGKWTPNVSEFGVAEEILATIRDEIASLNVNFISANVGKKKKPKPAQPYPRPHTARDRAKKRWQVDDVMAIVTAVTPQAADQVGRALGADHQDE